MTRRIHSTKGIFFKDPFVFVIQYESNDVNKESKHLEFKRKMYKLINGNYGWTQIKTDITNTPSLPQTNQWFTQWTEIYRSYWCFENELDALQFKITAGNSANRIYMWPTDLLFTYSLDEE